jgi:hypothetical protein
MQMSTLPQVSTFQLRRVIESMDALRNEPLRLYHQDGELGVARGTLDTPLAATDDRTDLLEVRTDDAPGHTPADGVTLHLGGVRRELKTTENFDAVFWTESAIQKFVFAYYVSRWSPADFEQFWDTYWRAAERGVTIHAITHNCSVPFSIDASGTVSPFVELQAITSQGASDTMEVMPFDALVPSGAAAA